MKIAYFPDTKTLDITFADRAATDNEDIADGVILSRDERGIVGLTIEDTDTVPGFDPSVLVNASGVRTDDHRPRASRVRR